MCATTPVVGVGFFFLSNVGSGDLSRVLMLARELLPCPLSGLLKTFLLWLVKSAKWWGCMKLDRGAGKEGFGSVCG